MKKIYIYNAGPLFTEYEVKQRKLEGELIRNLLDSKEVDYELGNPIDFPVNPEGEDFVQPEPKVIYETDASFIDKTTHFFFDLCNDDTGTYVELGMAFEKLRQNKDVKLYVVHSDFRAMSNSRKGFHSTIGFNSFVVGGINQHGFKLFTSFDNALNEFKMDIEKNG